MSDDNKATEYALMDELTGSTFGCKDENHAIGMMASTSVMLPPMERRVIATREVTRWEKVEGSEKLRRT